MPVHLNEYEALIQLLIGSVFIAMLFQREDFLSEIRQTFTSRISIPNYELVSEDEWKQRLKTLRKSIMVVLATYGCMVLYYCANFHLNNHIDSKTAFIIIEISPTLSGIALLSFCVTISLLSTKKSI